MRLRPGESPVGHRSRQAVLVLPRETEPLRPQQDPHPVASGEGPGGGDRPFRPLDPKPPGPGHFTVQPGPPPDESAHEWRRGLLVEFLRRANLLQPPVLEHRDQVTEVEGVLLLVGHDDGRESDAADEGAELAAGALTERRIEVGKRLVEQQDAGRWSECTGQRHPLLLTA